MLAVSDSRRPRPMKREVRNHHYNAEELKISSSWNKRDETGPALFSLKTLSKPIKNMFNKKNRQDDFAKDNDPCYDDYTNNFKAIGHPIPQTIRVVSETEDVVSDDDYVEDHHRKSSSSSRRSRRDKKRYVEEDDDYSRSYSSDEEASDIISDEGSQSSHHSRRRDDRRRRVDSSRRHQRGEGEYYDDASSYYDQAGQDDYQTKLNYCAENDKESEKSSKPSALKKVKNLWKSYFIEGDKVAQSSSHRTKVGAPLNPRHPNAPMGRATIGHPPHHPYHCHPPAGYRAPPQGSYPPQAGFCGNYYQPGPPPPPGYCPPNQRGGARMPGYQQTPRFNDSLMRAAYSAGPPYPHGPPPPPPRPQLGRTTSHRAMSMQPPVLRRAHSDGAKSHQLQHMNQMIQQRRMSNPPRQIQNMNQMIQKRRMSAPPRQIQNMNQMNKARRMSNPPTQIRGVNQMAPARRMSAPASQLQQPQRPQLQRAVPTAPIERRGSLPGRPARPPRTQPPRRCNSDAGVSKSRPVDTLYTHQEVSSDDEAALAAPTSDTKRATKAKKPLNIKTSDSSLSATRSTKASPPSSMKSVDEDHDDEDVPSQEAPAPSSKKKKPSPKMKVDTPDAPAQDEVSSQDEDVVDEDGPDDDVNTAAATKKKSCKASKKGTASTKKKNQKKTTKRKSLTKKEKKLTDEDKKNKATTVAAELEDAAPWVEEVTSISSKNGATPLPLSFNPKPLRGTYKKNTSKRRSI